MRLARKLVLLAMMAIAAMAVVAPSAFAQNEPLVHNQDPQAEVRAEPGGGLCPAVTPAPPAPATPEVFTTGGGCRLHITGPDIVLTAHVFGIESTDSTCDVEFDMRVDGQGEGYLSHFEFTPTASGQGTCTRRACHQSEAGTPPPTGQSEGRPWGFWGREVATGAINITALFCVEPRGNPNGAETHCQIVLPLTEIANHHYRVVGNDTPCAGTAGFRGEITGTLEAEEPPFNSSPEGAYSEVEINHL
jgi:hypothetical protein